MKIKIFKPSTLGNPLICDCETLWLRKMVSEYAEVVEDEPRCYFPKELAGNPLRKLRTSRFTCDKGRSRNDDSKIHDACHGIPLKDPVQKNLQNAIESGNNSNNSESYSAAD